MKTLIVIGHRWFDTKRGNTYHTVEVITDRIEKKSGVTYGYDDAYLQTAIEILEREGELDPEREHWDLSWHCRDNGIKYVNRVLDVSRKRDL